MPPINESNIKAIEVGVAATDLAKYARGAEKQPILLTSNGRPIAAIVGLNSVDMESFSLSDNDQFLRIIEKSRARYRKEGGVRSEALRQRDKKARKTTKKSVAKDRSDDGTAKKKLTHERLRKLAKKQRPPDNYFVGDMERPW